jgi:hypothetical protein
MITVTHAAQTCASHVHDRLGCALGACIAAPQRLVALGPACAKPTRNLCTAKMPACVGGLWWVGFEQQQQCACTALAVGRHHVGVCRACRPGRRVPDAAARVRALVCAS